MLVFLHSLALAAPLVTGTVLDERGEPVEGVSIDAARVSATGVSHRTDVVTDADGRYSVPAVDGVEFVRVQARIDGRTSEARFPSRFPAEEVLRLRPAARLELIPIGVTGPLHAVAVMHRREVVDLGGVQIHDGELDGILAGPAGSWSVAVTQDQRAARLIVDIAPGETLRVRVPLAAPAELGVRLPDSLRGDRGVCMLEPGAAHDASRGIPTLMDCHELEPPSLRLGEVAGGDQLLTVVQGEHRHRYTLVAEGGTWCGFQLPEPEEPGLAPGLVGASFELASAPPRVASVVAGSPAEQAGFVKGDLVLEVDGQGVSTGLEALLAVRAAPDQLVLLRGREGKKKKVKLQKTPAAEPPRVNPERCGDRPQPPPPEEREPYGFPVSPAPWGR